MPAETRIASARLHRADSAAHGVGGRAIADFLQSHAGDEYAVVEVERKEGRFSLIVDPDWIEFARSADESIIDDMDLPRSTLLAVVAGWAIDWSKATSEELTVVLSDDKIPHLRLASFLHSTSGAERNARPN